MNAPLLYTERFRLRPLEHSDAPAIFAYASDPEVSRYTAWEPHNHVEDAVAFVQSYAFPRYAQGLPDPLGIVHRGQQLVVGTVGCFRVTPDMRTMELAYALAQSLWGRGIIVETSAAVLDFVFAHFPTERVQARCKVENKASARVMEKLGMQREGVLRAALFHRERYWDMAVYSILRTEWLSRPIAAARTMS
ncbi:MAG: GNAT family N-acetyltransferase [Myxococcota bacterium]